MDEWQYTLVNGLITTAGVVVVGCLALYGALRQAERSQQGMNRQAQALLDQVDRSAETAREQARWQLRRDAYARLISACLEYEEKADEAGWFLADQLDEDGELIAPVDSAEYGEKVGAASVRLRFQATVVRLEGPEELESYITCVTREAGRLFVTLYHWAGALSVGRDDSRLDDWQDQKIALGNARENLLNAMYGVLHR